MASGDEQLKTGPATKGSAGKGKRVLVLFNFVGEDQYERMRKEGAKEVDFELNYNLNVATLREEIQALVDALTEAGYQVSALNVEDKFGRLLWCLRSEKPDIVFNLVEFFNDRTDQESFVAGLYELLKIPYTGSPPLTLALCQRKGLAKAILARDNIPTPRYKIIDPTVGDAEPDTLRHNLRYPLIVKPVREDASLGVENESVVSDKDALDARVKLIHERFKQPALVEEFIEGRELGVAVLGNSPPIALPISEMDFSGMPDHLHKIISYQAKWDPYHQAFHTTKSVCPAKLEPEIEAKVKEIAVAAFQLLGCRDYARVDMRLDSEGRPFVLEVNPNPDLTQGVAFMESSQAAGMSFAETLGRIVEMALARPPVLSPAGIP